MRLDINIFLNMEYHGFKTYQELERRYRMEIETLTEASIDAEWRIYVWVR